MEDQEIVELYFHRDEQAIVQTDRKYGPYCYSVAYNVLSDQEDARECVSDTYLAAWNRIPPARPSLLGAFLGKITRHLSIDRWRRRSAYKRTGGQMTFALEELGRSRTGERPRRILWAGKSWQQRSTAFCKPCPRESAVCSSAATGT